MEDFRAVKKNAKPLKVAYLHRPQYHPLHAAYARGVGADFIPIDKFLPESENEKPNKFRIYARMFLNGFFSRARRYDIIISDEVKPEAAIMKLTSFKKKKLIATQASYTLTRMYEKKLSKFNEFILKKIINKYYAVICVGDELYNIARKMCSDNSAVFIAKIYNGVHEDRIAILLKNQYNPFSRTIVSIANCFSRDTYNYKGVDIMISVFDKLLRSHPDLDYLILGNFNEEINDGILAGYPEHTRQRISFKPFDTDIAKYLGKALLYLQLSRYEAFGIAVTEAAFAGIPAFVSDQVGARVMFSDLENRDDFIVENENDGDAVKKILSFMDLPAESKMEISSLFRIMAQPYSQEKAVQNYKRTFETALGLNS